MLSDAKIIKRFEKDFEKMQNHWSKLHKRFIDDTEFLWLNKHFSKIELKFRTGPTDEPTPPRPTEPFPILKPFIIKVVNGIKKMKPALKVIPVDSQDDVELAEVRRGIIRSIEKNSGAIPARLQAVKDTVGSGFGFYRFTTDFSDPKSMNQDFKYKTVLDATKVLYDDDSTEPDGSDNKKTIVFEPYGKEEFKVKFGKEWDEVYEAGMSSSWGNSEKPVVSEYWFIEEKKETLYTVDGKGFYESELDDMAEQAGVFFEELIDYDQNNEPITRETHSREVWCCKMAGRKILEKTLWPGYWIPIFKIEGRKTLSQGEIRLDGLTGDGKASQRAYDYARNGQLERMALSPKNPYFYAHNSLEKKDKSKLVTANFRNWAGIGYNAYDKQNRPLPPPSRLPPVQVDPGLANEAMTASEEIKASLGMYASYMGETTGAQSGRSILAGAAESQDIVYDFSYNMALTVQFENRVLNEVIPKVIDTARQVQMVGEDDIEKVVMVNQRAINEKKEDYYYDLKQGKFDIFYEIGPSDESKRLETREGIKSFVQLLGPQFGPLFADLMAKESDFRYADELAARAKKFIQKNYPGIIDPDPKEEQQDTEKMQMQQFIQELQGQMQQMTQEYEALKRDKQIEAEKVKNADMAAEEDNEIKVYTAETNRLKVESDAKVNIEKLRLDAQKQEQDYRLQLEKIEIDRQRQITDTNKQYSDEQINSHFDKMKKEIEKKLSDIQRKDNTKPPVFKR